MYFSKENSNFPSPLYHKTPYARQNNQKPEPTASKILTKPRTSETSYGRSLVPMKPLSLNNTYTNSDVQNYQNHEKPSTSFDNNYNYPDSVYGITITSCFAENVRKRPDYETVHFRPRKSQLGNRSLENTYDHSTEMKMMSIVDTVEVTDKLKASNFKTTSESSTKGFQIKSRQNLMRIFTGSVENILHWAKLKNSLQILFEVTATVDFIKPGKWKTEKIFYLSDTKSGFKLQVVYHEIDRPLPRLAPDSLVTCVGRLLTRNRLQAYKVEECTEDKKKDLQRLSFICNRVADELVAAGFRS